MVALAETEMSDSLLAETESSFAYWTHAIIGVARCDSF